MLSLPKFIIIKIFLLLPTEDIYNFRLTCKKMRDCSLITSDVLNLNKNGMMQTVIYDYEPPKLYLPDSTKIFCIKNISCIYHMVLNENLETIKISKDIINSPEVLIFIDKYCKNLKNLECNLEVNLKLYEFSKTLKKIIAFKIYDIYYPMDYVKGKYVMNINADIDTLKCGNFPVLGNVNNLTYYNNCFVFFNVIHVINIKKLTLHNCHHNEFKFQNVGEIVLKNCDYKFIKKMTEEGIKFTIKTSD